MSGVTHEKERRITDTSSSIRPVLTAPLSSNDEKPDAGEIYSTEDLDLTDLKTFTEKIEKGKCGA